MMKKFSLVFIVIIVAMVSCKKKDIISDPVITDSVISDARTVLLKNIEADRLPSPYYHFEYDSLHFVKRISFASDFFAYDVSYENKRVSKMTNIIHHSSLVYKYTDKQVSEINEFSGTNGKLVFNYHFSYNSDKQLEQVLWYHYPEIGDSFLFKRADLVYQPDGNLASIDWYYTLSPGPLNWLSRSEFSDYDNRTNATDIVLLKEDYFFDSYLFLPQVRLQKSNPRKEHIISSTNEYFISNTYEYQNNLPVTKVSLVNQTKGGDLPGPIEVSTHFTYY